MIESLDEAREELKRVDHLIYVSLKYTRTVDVIINIVNRMIQGYDHIMEALLRWAKEQKKLDTIPIAPIERANLIKELYPDDADIKVNLDLYVLLRQMLKAQIHRESEYRRHVTMITYINGKKEILNIDIMTEYYLQQMALYEKVAKMVQHA